MSWPDDGVFPILAGDSEIFRLCEEAAMKRRVDAGSESTSDRNKTPLILVGAQDELPSQHVWFEGAGYSIYAAEQPASSWLEHTHDCAQITVGLEPAHVQATWINSAKSGGQREISGNMVSIIPPGEPHSTVWQRRAILIHIYIGKQLLQSIATEVGEVASPDLRPVYLVRDIFLEELGRNLFRECQGRAPHKLIADSAINVLVAYLLRNYGVGSAPGVPIPGSLGPARERRIREYIEQHLEQDLSIHALAAVLGMNPQYFANAFKLTTGFTPHRYVTYRRIDRAQQLLAEPDLPLADIAYRCGFKSQGQFTTLFRQLTGKTPGKFRGK
jgi:AraC family transcriptional regulator